MTSASGQPEGGVPAAGAGGAAGGKAKPLRLHLGGEKVMPGWSIVNIQPGPGVDYIGSVTDLSAFGDATVSEIYASHVYEHLDYRGELQAAFKEAYRVLRPRGVLRAAVPDLMAVCELFINPANNSQQRHDLMQVLYGGQSNPFDYHKVGFSPDLLAWYLSEAGFKSVQRVERFNLLEDTSLVAFQGRSISLNVMAFKG